MVEESTIIDGGSFVPSTHSYFNASKVRVPSVTQTLALLGMVNYEFIDKEVLARKSQLGVAVHSAVQFLTEGCLDWDTVAEEAMPYVVAAEVWMKEQGFVSVAQEEQGICTLPGGMSFGWMADQRGTLLYKGRQRHVILDLKTTVATSPTWKLQTAAYALAAPKLPPGERYLRCILQLRADGSFRPYYYEDRQDELAWQYALFIAIWGLNEGIYTLEKV